ncbi:hypothetical protein ZWY2020_027725 [Hordeum vulgare]|nr:hypothetical protein ZWY2020_027725 [Hordeum vulgare]
MVIPASADALNVRNDEKELRNVPREIKKVISQEVFDLEVKDACVLKNDILFDKPVCAGTVQRDADELFGNSINNKGLTAIVDNCRHLESLDIRHCFNVSMDDALRARSGPNESPVSSRTRPSTPSSGHRPSTPSSGHRPSTPGGTRRGTTTAGAGVGGGTPSTPRNTGGPFSPSNRRRRSSREGDRAAPRRVRDEDLKKAKDQLSFAAGEGPPRRRAQRGQAGRQRDTRSSRTLMAKRWAEEATEIEKFSADELQSRIDESQKRDEEWQREVESVWARRWIWRRWSPPPRSSRGSGLADAKKAESEVHQQFEEWKNKAGSLEMELEEATLSEKAKSDTLISMEEELYKILSILQDRESEMEVLKGKTTALEIEVARLSTEINESSDHRRLSRSCLGCRQQ